MTIKKFGSLQPPPLRRRHPLRKWPPPDRHLRQIPRRGVDPAVVDTFPLFEYSAVKGVKRGAEALECAVSLNEYEDDDNLRLLPICSHVFHPNCIDAWLASHVTCPVCRSNDLTPAPLAETPEDETRDEMPLRDVAVDVAEESSRDLQPDVINPNQIPIPIRSKSSRRQFRFPRSHTTGHSLVPPGENVERFTLSLPEHFRKEVVDGKLNRSASCAAFRTGGRSVSGGSGRPRVLKVGGEGGEESGHSRFQWRFNRAAKSDRWAFLMPPSFFSITFSVRTQGGADGDQTANGKGALPSVKTPFDCLGGKAEAAELAASRCSSPVFTVSTE